MKRFLNFKVSVCSTQQITQGIVIASMLVMTSACSTGADYGSSGYYVDNTIQNTRLSAGETAVVDQAGSRKVNAPHFLTNDPYTALSPDEMIRLYGK